MSQTEQPTEQTTEQSVEQSTEQSTEQQSVQQTRPQAHTGRVKWFNNTRGFGFLTYKDENGADLDVFVHFSSIRSQQEDSFKTLTQGEYVSFDLADSNKQDKLLAVNVTGVNGGPLLSDQRAINRARRTEYNSNREDGQEHREHRPRQFRRSGGRGRGRGGFRGPRSDEPRRPFNPEQ